MIPRETLWTVTGITTPSSLSFFHTCTHTHTHTNTNTHTHTHTQRNTLIFHMYGLSNLCDRSLSLSLFLFFYYYFLSFIFYFRFSAILVYMCILIYLSFYGFQCTITVMFWLFLFSICFCFVSYFICDWMLEMNVNYWITPPPLLQMGGRVPWGSLCSWHQ